MSDEKILIQQAQAGDKKALENLIEIHYQKVFEFCYFQIGNHEAAYDCTQETFCKVMKYLNYYQERNKFRAYLLTIARNICNDYFRHQQINTIDEEAIYQLEDKKNSYREVEDKLLLKKFLAKLPDIQREVIILRFYHDLKMKEIAKITGEKLPTVKSRLNQALKKLKKMMKGEVEQ